MVATWIGSLPAWLTLATIIIAGVLAARGSLGPALNYYREANDALTKQVNELKKLLANERKENVTLRATRDLEPLQQALLESLSYHEERASARGTAILNILNMIALKLGPDLNSHKTD